MKKDKVKKQKMSHFAELDENNIVKRVIVADREFIDSGKVGSPQNWIETSYGTVRGKHLKGGVPFRKNYAGIGYKYDAQKDAFIPPKRFASWIFDEEAGDWIPPKPEPPKSNDKYWVWDENIVDWVDKLNQ